MELVRNGRRNDTGVRFVEVTDLIRVALALLVWIEGQLLFERRHWQSQWHTIQFAGRTNPSEGSYPFAASPSCRP